MDKLDSEIIECENRLENLFNQIGRKIDTLDLKTETQLQGALCWLENSFSGWEENAIKEVEFNYHEEVEDILAEQLYEKYEQMRVLKDRIFDRYLDCIGCSNK